MPNRPNVLFLMCDQFRFDAIAALGNPYVRTPNLDRLVRTGMAFTNAYSTCPVCIPARYTVRTGRDPHTTGCYSNEAPVPLDGLPAMEARCGAYLARTMRDLGYRTFGAGKFHTHPDAHEDLGYETQIYTEELWSSPEDRERDAYASFIAREHPEYRHIQQLHGERTNMYYVPQVSPFPPELTVEGFLADRACRELEKDDGRPYFGFVSFPGPHPPCAPPVPYNLLYNPDEMPNPVKGDLENDHLDEQIPWMNYLIWADELGDFDARNVKSRYYGEITYIDACIGQILDAVERRNDADQTLICFFSDHGDFLGDHHAWQKESYFEQAAHVPFLLRWPERFAGSNSREELVCLTDLFGIATGAAGAEDTRDGISVLRLLSGDAQPRSALYACYGRPGTPLFKVMVRRDAYKWIYFANGNRSLLFQLDEDPQELHPIQDVRLEEAFRAEAVEYCRRPGLYAALDGMDLRAFPFVARPKERIRQFDHSHGVTDFLVHRKEGI